MSEINFVYYTDINSKKANVIHYFKILYYAQKYEKMLGVLPLFNNVNNKNEFFTKSYNILFLKGFYFKYLLNYLKNKFLKFFLYEFSRFVFYINYIKLLATNQKKLPYKIITQDPTGIFILSLFKPLRSKLIYYTHVFSLNPLHRFYEHVWFRTRFQKKIIVISPGLKKIYELRYKVHRKNTHFFVFPNGVDECFFKSINKKRAREKTNIPQNKFIVSYIGRFYTDNMEKGIKKIISNIFILHDDVEFYFVGASPQEKNEYERYIKNTYKDKVKILPFVSHNRVKYYMYASDILIIPYPNNIHFNYFASPMKLFEYMATGKPIISSDLYIHKKYLREFGIYFDSKDIKSFFKVLHRVKSNYDYYYNISKKGKQYAWNHYRWSAKIKDFIHFIGDDYN